MKKTILAVLLLALAVPATAHGKRATTLKAKFAPSADSGVRGQARLVDGKRRDRVRLRVKGLEAGATYTWSIRRAAAGGDACAGATVASFSYSSLEARRRGAARGRSSARRFAAGDGAYAVVITDAAGADVACAELRGKGKRKQPRSEDITVEEETAFDEEEELEEPVEDEPAEEDEDLAEDEDPGEDEEPSGKEYGEEG